MGRDSMATNPSVNITQIKAGSVITGSMKSKHSIRVEGHVAGDLISDEKIIIGRHGEIGGNLGGTDITIEGYVMGDVLAKGTLHISDKAEIEGQIFAKEVSIEKGAQLNGQISVCHEVEIPDMVEKEKAPEKETKSIPVEPQTPSKAAGDNYGTVAW